MRKSQNVKVKDAGVTVGRIAGRISCLGLVGLGLLAINPACESVNALTAEELANGSLTSAVNISFAPTSGNTTLSPTNAAGASGLISVLANVGVTNSGGYSVYLGSSDTNLVGVRNKDVTIPGVSGEVSFENLQDNTWGYTVAEGASIPESATYKAVSKGQGDTIFTNNSSRIGSENKTFALGFAAKIDNSLPADTYQNQVTLSIVSSPYQLTLMDIDDMQEMTSAVCENTPQLATKQLRDARDGKYYWVTKLADNRCWMTQNLDLDLSTNVALTPEDSDVTASWMPEYTTASTVDGNTISSSSTGQSSWSLGNFRITNPTESNDCGGGKASVADCPSQFTTYTTPALPNKDENAHYILGNYYQWNAATAGTGGAITDGQATSSICPKGWRLPTSTASGEFQALITASFISTNVAKLTSAPYFFVRGGYVTQSASTLFNGAGDRGIYWSSTPRPDGTNAYRLYFENVSSINPSGSYSRGYGFSVRCIAR